MVVAAVLVVVHIRGFIAVEDIDIFPLSLGPNQIGLTQIKPERVCVFVYVCVCVRLCVWK